MNALRRFRGGRLLLTAPVLLLAVLLVAAALAACGGNGAPDADDERETERQEAGDRDRSDTGRRRTDGLNPRAAGCRGASVPRPPRGLTLLALPPLYCQRPRSRPARRGRRTAARYCRPRRHRQARTRRPCSPYSTPLTAKYGIPVAGDRRRSQPRLRNRPGSYRPKKPHSHHQLRRRSWVLSEGTEAAWPQLENGLVLPRTAGDVLSRCNSPA